MKIESKINFAYIKDNQNEEIIITAKVQPIIKAWLADSFSKAKSEIDQFEYKSDGLVMSDIYYLHLALLNNFYNDKANAINIFEKILNSGVANRSRHMFFYKSLTEDKVEETANADNNVILVRIFFIMLFFYLG